MLKNSILLSMAYIAILSHHLSTILQWKVSVSFYFDNTILSYFQVLVRETVQSYSYCLFGESRISRAVYATCFAINAEFLCPCLMQCKIRNQVSVSHIIPGKEAAASRFFHNVKDFRWRISLSTGKGTGRGSMWWKVSEQKNSLNEFVIPNCIDKMKALCCFIHLFVSCMVVFASLYLCV